MVFPLFLFSFFCITYTPPHLLILHNKSLYLSYEDKTFRKNRREKGLAEKKISLSERSQRLSMPHKIKCKSGQRQYRSITKIRLPAEYRRLRMCQMKYLTRCLQIHKNLGWKLVFHRYLIQSTHNSLKSLVTHNSCHNFTKENVKTYSVCVDGYVIQ